MPYGTQETMIKTRSLGAQRRNSAFALLCFMKLKTYMLRYGVACPPLVKCRFTAPALGWGAAPICGIKSSYPACNMTPWGPARTRTNQRYINTKQHNRWPIRPYYKLQRTQTPNIFIDIIMGSAVRLVRFVSFMSFKKQFMAIVCVLASRYISFLSNAIICMFRVWLGDCIV